MPADIAALPSPRIALLLGGPGAGYVYDAATIADFAAQLRHIADEARQPPDHAVAPHAARAARRGRCRDRRQSRASCGRGAGDNPYPHFLANADVLIVTADFGEHGRRSLRHRPAGLCLHTRRAGAGNSAASMPPLQAHGATRPLPTRPARLQVWSYEPLQAAERVAAEIDRPLAQFPVDNRRGMTCARTCQHSAHISYLCLSGIRE